MFVAETRGRCDRLRHRWPETAAIIEPLLAAIQDAAALLDPAEPAPVHGDLAAGQFLWTGDRLVLLDLDMFGYADPAYDAGHFLAQLERRCLWDRTLLSHADGRPRAARASARRAGAGGTGGRGALGATPMNPPPTTLSAVDVGGALAAALRAVHGADGTVEIWSAHPLSKRGKHRVVRYDVQGRMPGDAEVHHQRVGKFYERDEDA